MNSLEDWTRKAKQEQASEAIEELLWVPVHDRFDVHITLDAIGTYDLRPTGYPGFHDAVPDVDTKVRVSRGLTYTLAEWDAPIEALATLEQRLQAYRVAVRNNGAWDDRVDMDISVFTDSLPAQLESSCLRAAERDRDFHREQGYARERSDVSVGRLYRIGRPHGRPASTALVTLEGIGHDQRPWHSTDQTLQNRKNVIRAITESGAGIVGVANERFSCCDTILAAEDIAAIYDEVSQSSVELLMINQCNLRGGKYAIASGIQNKNGAEVVIPPGGTVRYQDIYRSGSPAAIIAHERLNSGDAQEGVQRYRRQCDDLMWKLRPT